ncbi:MAG: 3-methyl-2-oxobutanoate hydroxymethyltransferase [Magnetococcales bacterium]|nr:3-methyl-2-oxobutanoate hydroxymethyltransferase [Magnetococcales bacterium]
MTRRVTLPDLIAMKGERKIVSVTAYDFSFARLLDRANIDILLVGDSLGMVIQGHDTTLPVTLDEMIYHTRAVARGAERALVVCDLPFGDYQSSPEAAMASSARAMKEGACHAVKLEGGEHMAETIRFLTTRGIPVMGHVGLTPQSVHAFGGFRMQGRGEAGEQVMADALAVAEAGAGLLILEGIPAPLATHITQRVHIPTIGIGAGPDCDGQVLVLYDLLGLFEGVAPKFVKHYLEGGSLVGEAVNRFAEEVREGRFPGPEHTSS